MNTFKLQSTQNQKVKLYFVDWVEFYLLGGILPRDHLVTWLSGDVAVEKALSMFEGQIAVISFGGKGGGADQPPARSRIRLGKRKTSSS